MKEKRIFFHLLNNFTGSPQILRNVIEVAVNEGYEVLLYTSSTRGFLSDIPGVIYRPNYYHRSERQLITLFTFFLSQLLLGLVLFRHWQDKCLFYTNTILPFSAILSGRLMGKRVITHVHENEVSPKILDTFLFWVVRTFSSQKIVVSSFLFHNLKLGQTNITLIPNVVNPKLVKNSFPVNWSKSEFQVLMLASLRPYKGIQEFVELADKIPEVFFTLVLSDNEKEVKEWRENLTFGQNLKIHPVQETVVPFYRNAHLIMNLAHPEKWLETFGMTVLEGFYFGLPAIVPNQGGVAELVEDGVNGYKIDYREWKLQVATIKELAQNQVLWESLSIGALNKSKEYSLGEFNQRILNLLK